jgi:hypothetical protein
LPDLRDGPRIVTATTDAGPSPELADIPHVAEGLVSFVNLARSVPDT